MSIESKLIWLNGELVPWDEAKDHTVIHALHYGTSVFEGIRFYKTLKGSAIFRLEDHIKRFFYSASVLNMDLSYSEEDLIKACKLVVKENSLENGYIRPIARYGYGKMGLNPKGAKINVEVSAWNWGKYLSEKPVRVGITKFIRLHPDSAVMDAKIGGYYVNSVFANLDAKNNGYDEALLLDWNGYIAEGPGENIFFIKGNVLYTPKKGAILPGITRDTIINAIAPDLGFEVKEINIKPEDLGNFEEAFFVGTAAEVTPIASITDRNGKIFEYEVNKNLKIRDYYMDIVHGRNTKRDRFLTYVD